VHSDDAFRANFYHCDGRHHTLALGLVSGTAAAVKLHHLRLETVGADNLGAAFDRAVAAGVEIPDGLGKHANDRVFSFCSVTPAGFRVELGAGAGAGAVIVGDAWPVLGYGRVSSWGHQRFTPTLLSSSS
jgi:hypothetical protein